MITFPTSNLRNLGIKHPNTQFQRYTSFFESFYVNSLNNANKASIPKSYTKSLFDNSLRQNKDNTLLVYKRVVLPIYSQLINQNFYRFRYFIYDTSTKNKLLNSVYYYSYTEALNTLHSIIVDCGDDKSTQYLIRVDDSSVIDILSLYNSNLPNDITWRDSFNGVRRALRYLKDPESMVCEYARWTGIPREFLLHMLNIPLAYAIPFFKLIKTTIHHNIDGLPPELRYFFDLEILAGYPKMNFREFTDDPVKWLSIDDTTIYTDDWWCQQFTETFSLSNRFVPEKLITLKEFTLSRWLWVTDGASRFSKLMLGDEKVKTKFGAALSLSDDELLDLVFNSTKNNDPNNIIGVFIKPDEKGYKRRLIANVQLGFYIVASYIRYILDLYTGSNPIYMKLSPNLDEQYELLTLIRERRVTFPLDESAYDYHVTPESWRGFIKFLPTAVSDSTAVSLFENFYAHAFWRFENQTGTWTSGMPSGLALTSYLNSWMNYIKQTQILKGYINWAAGDDVLAVPYDSKYSLEDIETYYATFGSVANASKNWTSRRYAEYLKTFYTSAGTSGYPARVFSSLLWAGTERFFLPSDRLPELFELFKQFFDRIGIQMPERYVAADLSRAVASKIPNFNVRVAIDYMHAPRVHGGMGKLPYNNKTFTWDVEHHETRFYTNARIRVPRNIRCFGRVSLNIGTYQLKPNVSYKLGNTYTLPPINTLSDWEARINREDIDYHGPFQSLILDTIPLPTLDFISTNQMSNFAKTNYFNAFPNLTGSWNTIASRLVKASLALSQLMLASVSDHCVEVLL